MQPHVHVLSKPELERLHDRTLHVLATTGVRVDSPRCRDLLEEAGATVNRATHRVTLPGDVVVAAIAAAPRRFSLGSRRPGWRHEVNRNQCTLCLNGEGTRVTDRASSTVRPATLRDLREVTRLADALDEIGVYWRSVTPGDVGASMADFVRLASDVQRNFSKHVQDPFMHPQQAPWLLEVLQTVHGDRETIRREHPYSTLMCPQSPLILTREYTEAALALKGWQVPVAVMPMALMGATAPASMLGTLIQCNCEVLAALCLIQANDPGTPFLYAAAPTLMDPRSARYFCGGVENALLNTATVDIARHYGLPVVATAFGTDAFTPGVQSGCERTLLSVMPALARPDILIGPGLFGGDMILNLDQVVMDVEMFRLLTRQARGIVSDEERWMDDVIGQVGPGGEYLSHASTARAVRSGEWTLPRLGVHDTFDNWQAGGRPDLLDEVRDTVAHLLATHVPEPLDDAVEGELRRILDRAAAVEGDYPFL